MPYPSKIKLSLRLIRLAFKHLGGHFPYLGGYWACQLWFATQRFPPPAREALWGAAACEDRVRSAGRQLARYQWGDPAAPGVLLIHGWNGRGLQLGGFAAPLLERGLRVIAFDAPAHGASPGSSTHIIDYAQAVLDVAAASGPLCGAIAHSFGVPAVARALAHGLQLPRLVSIAAPANAAFLVQRFAKHLQIPPPVIDAMRARIERRFGMDIFLRLSTEGMLAGVAIPGLIVHDANDRDVPFAHAERLLAAWKTARLISTEGLGHNRILRDSDVIASVVEFLQP